MADDLDPVAEGTQIAPLGSLDDFEVADDFPDPRGWDVVLADGKRIGEVDELIVDTQALRTRYLDVDLDSDAVGLTENKHVLIPVGAARLNDDSDDVILDSMDLSQIAAMPAYDQSAITRDYENSIVSGIGRDSGLTGQRADERNFYSQQSFDDNRFYGNRWRRDRETREAGRDEARITRSEEELAIGKRRVQAGEVSVEKQVETEHVSEPVSVRREEVTVERRPVEEGKVARDATIGEDEIRVPVTEEELIVEKRPVVKEEIVIRKQAVEDTKEVEADVRKERVEIDDNTTHRDLNR
jgi:uncharacterized protein (TIGR02271 family)